MVYKTSVLKLEEINVCPIGAHLKDKLWFDDAFGGMRVDGKNWWRKEQQAGGSEKLKLKLEQGCRGVLVKKLYLSCDSACPPRSAHSLEGFF